MSVNKFMHPRNPYRTPTDFKALAIEYPEFRKHAVQDLSGKVHIDFKNPNALRALTQTLLLKDFQLDVTIPDNRLIPTLPLRLNYILWIEDLLSEDPVKPNEIRGIDIGTGATCIYPLLGQRKNGWKFVATEVDEVSLSCAKANVGQNKLEESIHVLPGSDDNVLLDAVSEANEEFSFCMCNPPFFSNNVETTEDDDRKGTRKLPTNPGSSSEKIALGGEIEFVKKIIEDSVKLKNKIRIYTTMLGKKASVNIIKAELRRHNVEHFITTEFCQGKIVRWGIAWTFINDIPLQKVEPIKKKRKPPMTLHIPNTIADSQSLQDVRDKLVKLLESIKIVSEEKQSSKNCLCMHVIARENTWIHQRRQKRALLHQQCDEKPSSQINDNVHATSSTHKRPRDDVNGDEETSKDKRIRTEEINGTIPPSYKAFDQDPTNGSELQLENDSEVELPSNGGMSLSSDLQDEHDLNNATEGTVMCGELQQNHTDAVKHSATEVAADQKEKPIALHCELVLRKIGKNIILEMNWLNGPLGRNGVYQLMQFLKNRLK